jgi:phospholipase C
MSMSGISLIDVNQTPLPDQTLVYDWLNQKKISWRVYHQGIPFFALMPKWIPAVLFDDHFRSFDQLQSDLVNTPPNQLPQVIFLEPTYQDAPHIRASTDDHAPQGVSNGQEFLMQVYNAVLANPPLWKSSLLIVDYDEHGGFFDHVVPPNLTTSPPAGAKWSVPFKTLGVRVPAFVISPFVARGAVSHNLLDHTSVLKFLGEKFGGGSYSPEVDSRAVGSLSHLLDFTNPQFDPPAPPALDTYLQTRPPISPGVTVPPTDTPLQQAFSDAVENMKLHGADASHPKFGPLLA